MRFYRACFMLGVSVVLSIITVMDDWPLMAVFAGMGIGIWSANVIIAYFDRSVVRRDESADG